MNTAEILLCIAVLLVIMTISAHAYKGYVSEKIRRRLLIERDVAATAAATAKPVPIVLTPVIPADQPIAPAAPWIGPSTYYDTTDTAAACPAADIANRKIAATMYPWMTEPELCMTAGNTMEFTGIPDCMMTPLPAY